MFDTMNTPNPLPEFAFGAFLQTYLPDLILAFAFFTSICFAVLSRQFQQKRPAIAASAALGLALSLGLLWWEQANQLSIRNLGPIAVGFILLVIGLTLYAAVRQLGGSWVGALFTLCFCIFIAQIAEIGMPINQQTIQAIIMVTVILGVMAFISSQARQSFHFPPIVPIRREAPISLTELFRDRHLSNDLQQNIRHIRHKSRQPDPNMEETNDIVRQLQRMLPAEGYLTQRMAQLRSRVFQIRNGHVARLEETRKILENIPANAKKKASEQLIAKYQKMIGIDTRLERLETVVTENEKHIRNLTRQAQEYANRFNYEGLYDCLKQAEQLQKHNSRIIRLISHTENKLNHLAQTTANEVKQNEAKKSSPPK
ncbi:MAG: hypothetical protein A4E72_00950 [Syntrophus sp. PtaU1.Bin208]|nr:MAG: hypothetical protein A4E72_00950 [Syntrophus sp. PtaU1.Bin208]